MAPIKSSKGGKPSLGKVASKSSAKPAFKPKKVGTVSPAGKNKPKRTSGPVKKKKRVYTEKELGIPTLNGIVPAGVQKVKGKKKGKVFVDDQESMMTILAIVNAEKEGQIESKMIKARHMEEIREARRNEAEAKKDTKKSKLEETKDSLRRPRKKKPVTEAVKEAMDEVEKKPRSTKKIKKRVSFG